MHASLRSGMALTALFALACMTEYAIGSAEETLPVTGQEHNRFEQRKNAVRGKESSTVLFLGDSNAVGDINPITFDRLTGEKSVNLGTFAGTAGFADIALLQDSLRLHPPPRAVIVTRSIRMWPNEQNFDVYREQFPHAGITLALRRDGIFSLEQTLKALLAGLLPSVRNRAAIRTWMAGETAPETQVQDNGNDTRGFIPQTHILTVPVAQDSASIPRATKGIFPVIPPENIALLQDLCSLAEQRHIPLTLVTGPYADMLRKDDGVMQYVTHMRDMLRTAFTGKKFCRFDDTDRSYSSRLMADLTHLNNRGAEIFTREMADDHCSKYACSGFQ